RAPFAIFRVIVVVVIAVRGRPSFDPRTLVGGAVRLAGGAVAGRGASRRGECLSAGGALDRLAEQVVRHTQLALTGGTVEEQGHDTLPWLRVTYSAVDVAGFARIQLPIARPWRSAARGSSR